MKTRRPLAILAATAVAGLGLTALATPASANTTITISFDDPVTSLNPTSVSGTSVTLVNTGPVFYYVVSPSLTDSNGDTCVAGDPNELVNPPCDVNNSSTATFSIAQDAADASVELQDLSQSLDASFTVTYSDGTALSAAGGPAPVIQQFEKPATGTCDESQPEGLNWGGASSGGWGESWAQWMHEGQGGAVCTRTLAYNNSTATWQVQ